MRNFKFTSVLAAVSVAVACHGTPATQSKVAADLPVPVDLFAQIALDLLKYVGNKATSMAEDTTGDFTKTQINKVFGGLCGLVCEIVKGTEDEEVKEVDHRIDDLELQKDADLKENLGIEMQAIVNQAKKLVPGSKAALPEVIDLRNRLSKMEATITLTAQGAADPHLARRAVANFNTYLLFVGVNNWVGDLMADIEHASGSQPAEVAGHLQAQLNFLKGQASRLAQFSAAADTTLVNDVLKFGFDTRADSEDFGVERGVNYRQWAEFYGKRYYGSASHTKCQTSYDPDCAKIAEDEARELFNKEVLPDLQAQYRKKVFGPLFDSFNSQLSALTAPLQRKLDGLAEANVAPDTSRVPSEVPDSPDVDSGDGADSSSRSSASSADASGKTTGKR